MTVANTHSTEPNHATTNYRASDAAALATRYIPSGKNPPMTNTYEAMRDADGKVHDPEAIHDTPFKCGAFVADRDQFAEVHADRRDRDDLGVAIVVREGRTVADRVYVRDGKTVADLNPDYDADDPVVEVVYVGTLDGMVNGWRDNWPVWQLDWRITDYQKEWGVPITTYSYPAGRLMPAADIDWLEIPNAVTDAETETDDAQ